MTIALFTNSVSPHQLPLARELAKREGAENYRYIYTDALTDERKKLGWGGADEPWVSPFSTDGAREWLFGADVVRRAPRFDVSTGRFPLQPPPFAKSCPP